MLTICIVIQSNLSKLHELLTGGGRSSTTKDVLMYDVNEDKWESVGQLPTGHLRHGISLVPMDTADYCV